MGVGGVGVGLGVGHAFQVSFVGESRRGYLEGLLDGVTLNGPICECCGVLVETSYSGEASIPALPFDV